MSVERRDTAVAWLVRSHGVAAGYAVVRGYRMLNGNFADSDTVLAVRAYADNPIVPVTFLGHAAERMVGIVAGWRSDAIGLWCAIQLGQSPQFEQVVRGIDQGTLFFCVSHHPASELDQRTGRYTRVATHLLNLTPAPHFRPSSHPDARAYMDALAAGGYAVETFADELEELPLDEEISEWALP